jgi:hypothetical protein
MLEYFKTQTSSDFKNSKKFWQFYSTYIQVKSDKSSNSSINSLKRDDTIADNSFDIIVICSIFILLHLPLIQMQLLMNALIL